MTPLISDSTDYSERGTRNAARGTPLIGIIGGVGPFAGLDLQRKILEQTVAAADQEHLPVISVSWPGPIADRTEYLLGRVPENPAYAILEQLRLLAAAGATVAGIPCNTAHAPAIFDVIRAGVAAEDLSLIHILSSFSISGSSLCTKHLTLG